MSEGPTPETNLPPPLPDRGDRGDRGDRLERRAGVLLLLLLALRSEEHTSELQSQR